MNNKPYIFVANWKMRMPFNQACAFVDTNKNDLARLAQQQKATVVICPSFPALAPLAQHLNQTHVALGAQTCSSHKSGSYTGQVSPESLAHVGCSYCIVGHSERRKQYNETTQECLKKIELLLQENITPIYCIGEPEHIYTQGTTIEWLQEQVAGLGTLPAEKIIIAYEPIWAIGSGTIPDSTFLEKIATWLHKQFPTSRLLYGGSVDENTVSDIAKIAPIDGFLIGGASLDFQKLKKIVEFKQ